MRSKAQATHQVVNWAQAEGSYFQTYKLLIFLSRERLITLL
ncbi:hypothetical protein OSCI_870024 [Kamptonema sp. PCC 6506]|nr:hypothetical protein OSCI_870024 [Kamptonema sp. PCC 6506]